jgi:tetratricopeptide (TPR) repeat protein/CHAT domain-containing protein
MKISHQWKTPLAIFILATIISIPIHYAESKEAGTDTNAKLWQKAEELKKAGYYAKAIPIVEKVLTGWKADSVDNRAELARTLDYLGELNYLAGWYFEAESLLKESLSIRAELFGPDHINTAESYNHLGELYWLVGRSDESGSYLRKALSIREKAYGPNHPDNVETLVNLARLQVDVDNLDEAESLLQMVLDIQEKKQEIDRHGLVKTLNTLAWLYIDTDKYEEAEPYIHRALEIGEETFGSEHPFIADSLNYLGRLQYARKEHEASIATNKRALVVREKFLGPSHPDVGLSLNNLALPYCGLEQYEIAKQLFFRALSIREKAFGKYHPNLLVMLQNAGWVHEMLGDYSGAVALYEQALVINERQHGSDSIEVAGTRKDLAGLYYSQGDAEKAEKLLNEAQVIFEKILGADHPRVASTLSYLAFLNQAKGNYSKSEELYKRAIAISEIHFEKDPTNLGTSLSNLAALYVAMGEYEKAEENYRKALPIIEKALGPEHTQVAYVLNNMGRLYANLMDYQNAETLYKRALAIWEKAFGPDHPNVATTLDNLAMLYEYSNEYNKAEPLYQQSLKIRESFLGPRHPLVAKTLNNLSTLYSFMGNYDKAVQLYQRTLDVKAETIGTDNPSYANSLHNLAAVYLNQDQYEKAELLYKQALHIWIKAYGQDHPNVSTGYGHLSQLYADMGESQKAYDYAMQSLEIDNKLIDQVVGFTSESQKLRFIASNNWGLHYCLNLVNQQYHEDLSKREEVFDFWLKRKGLVLDVQKRYQQASIGDGNEEAVILFDKLNGVRTELSRLVFSPNAENADGYSQQKESLEAERDRLESQLSRISKPFALKQNTAKADSERVFKVLPPGTAMVDYARIDPEIFDSTGKVPARYVAFILCAGKGNAVEMVDLGGADKIDALVTKYKKQLTAGGNEHVDDALSMSRELYGLVLEPILNHFEAVKTIYISPDGNLNLIPFEVLQKSNGKFLVEDYTFNYLSASRDLMGFTDNQTTNKKCLLIGAPDFDLVPIGSLSHQGTSLSQRSADFGGLSFVPLPYARNELHVIGNILGPERAVIHTGKDALEETLLNADHPSIIHLATHGFFLSDQDVPGMGRGFQMAALPTVASHTGSKINGKVDIENPLLRSGILLAGAKHSLTKGCIGPHDGIVTAEKILGMNLQGTEMVVLSACDTGVGEVKSGEGVFGLRRAFTQAGAKSLVMSLWKVPDKETKELMVQFYRNIKSGSMNRCQALRQAILKEKEIVRKRYGHENPRYWGAFVFMGQS